MGLLIQRLQRKPLHTHTHTQRQGVGEKGKSKKREPTKEVNCGKRRLTDENIWKPHRISQLGILLTEKENRCKL